MKRYLQIWMLATAALLIASCGNDKEVEQKSGRSVQYFPNMYESVGYETYQEGKAFKGNVEAQKPVDGTVSRGWLPYDYDNTAEGYDAAKANLQNPLPYTEDNLINGAALYTVYCGICHGEKGNGKGHLVTTEKILGVPSYDDAGRNISQGSIYHVMYYGINNMGSYASQTSTEERWQIAHHVDALIQDLKGLPRKEFVGAGDIVLPQANVVKDEQGNTMEAVQGQDAVNQQVAPKAN